MDVLYETLPNWIDDSPVPYFKGPTLFIGGESSNYIRLQDADKIKEYFPQSTISIITNGSHYIHYEKMQEFLNILIPFIETNKI